MTTPVVPSQQSGIGRHASTDVLKRHLALIETPAETGTGSDNDMFFLRFCQTDITSFSLVASVLSMSAIP